MRNTPEHRDLMHEFEWLGKTPPEILINMDRIQRSSASQSFQGLSAESHAHLLTMGDRAQKHILAYLDMHGSLHRLRQDITDHMQMNLHPASIQDLMPRICAYALTCETPELPQILEGLQRDVGDEDLISVREAYRKHCFDPLKFRCRDFLPPFPVDYLFSGGALIYQFIYQPDHEAGANMIIEKLTRSELAMDHVQPLTALLAQNDPDETTSWTNRTFKHISLILRDLPLKPYLELRKLVNGTTDVSGAECSKRVDFMMRRIMERSGIPERAGTIAEYAEIIRSNESFYDRLLVTDLARFLSGELNSIEDNPDPDFDFGVEVWMRMAEFFKALRLSDADLTFLIMNVTGRATTGAALDVSEQDPSYGSTYAAKNLFRYRRDLKPRIETELEQTICFGIWQSMSQFSMGKALEIDEGKIVMHRLTNNRLLLNGIKDKSLIDESFSADLGL